MNMLLLGHFRRSPRYEDKVMHIHVRSTDLSVDKESGKMPQLTLCISMENPDGGPFETHKTIILKDTENWKEVCENSV